MVKKKLDDFCGKYTLSYHAVITLVYEDSETNVQNFHAVRVFKISTQLLCSFNTQCIVTLKETDLISNELILTTIDSATKTGETVVKVPLLNNGELQIGGVKDQWCLGNRYCYFLKL